jgi:hypothetical protein
LGWHPKYRNISNCLTMWKEVKETSGVNSIWEGRSYVQSAMEAKLLCYRGSHNMFASILPVFFLVKLAMPMKILIILWRKIIHRRFNLVWRKTIQIAKPSSRLK